MSFLEDPVPVGAENPSPVFVSMFAIEFNELLLLCALPEEETKGSEANAGGGPWGSVVDNPTG